MRNWALTVNIPAYLTLKPLPEAFSSSKPELVRANTPKMAFDDDYTLSEHDSAPSLYHRDDAASRQFPHGH